MLKLTALKNGNISNHALIIYHFSIGMPNVHYSDYSFPCSQALM